MNSGRNERPSSGYVPEEQGYQRYNDPPARGSSNRSNGRGSRGARGQSRGGGFSQHIKQTRNPINIKPLEHSDVKPAGIPLPQHLSKTTSELKNDPLYLDAFFPSPSEELVPIAEELNHHSGFFGLTTMINESYENFRAHSLNFKRSVPQSAYAYYIGVFAWARVLQIRKMNKYRLTTAEREFISVIFDEGNFIIPKSISIYLSGFGNFKIPSGVETKFNMTDYEYDEDGYFENMDQNYLCAFYPCISIFSQRIVADLSFTHNPALGTAWQPNNIDEQWNNRCIGYAPARTLQPLEARIYDSAGITRDQFPSDCDGFKINIRLLNAVQKYLSEIPSLESGPIPAVVTGTQGQLITEVPETLGRQTCENIGSCSFTSKAPLATPGPVSYLSGSFLYRIKQRGHRYLCTANQNSFFK